MEVYTDKMLMENNLEMWEMMYLHVRIMYFSTDIIAKVAGTAKHVIHLVDGVNALQPSQRMRQSRKDQDEVIFYIPRAADLFACWLHYW